MYLHNTFASRLHNDDSPQVIKSSYLQTTIK